jgi:hypothetical protein
MRVIFLTLHADNLPETGKRQYENQGDARAISAGSRQSENDTKGRDLRHHFFRQAKCSTFRCSAASEPDF